MPASPTVARRRSLRRAAYDHGQPIRLLPTAPITGVLLTIAVLCLGTWPAETQTFLIELVPPAPPSYSFSQHVHPYNTVTLTHALEIRWNGIRVSTEGLQRRLAETRKAERRPVLLFDPDPDASYDFSVEVLWLIKSAGLADEYFCFAHLERDRSFERPPTPPGTPEPSCHPELLMRE